MKIDQILEYKDMCNVCGQTPCNCTHLAESVGNIGGAIKSLYQKIRRAGDDEIEYFYNDSPIFAQYWDEYEGDLDSIIAEVDPGELQVMLDELESYVDQANLAEGMDRLYPSERTVIDYMQDNSWLSAERAYFRYLGLQKKKQTNPHRWAEEIQHYIDLYNKHKGQQGVAEGLSRMKNLAGLK